MARKLGWGSICLIAALMAGCQSGGGSRMANNNTGGGPYAKQALPPPMPVGARTPTSGNPSFGSAFPAGQSNITPAANNSPAPVSPSSQGLGTPSSSGNRPTDVTITQPGAPLVPPPQPQFAQPGLSPIQNP